MTLKTESIDLAEVGSLSNSFRRQKKARFRDSGLVGLTLAGFSRSESLAFGKSVDTRESSSENLSALRAATAVFSRAPTRADDDAVVSICSPVASVSSAPTRATNAPFAQEPARADGCATAAVTSNLASSWPFSCIAAAPFAREPAGARAGAPTAANALDSSLPPAAAVIFMRMPARAYGGATSAVSVAAGPP
eukprot:1434413-Pleurochrysis_carterae.AAC.1